nr:hypothetical protein [Tanacetum cinerariifolium]
FTKSEANTKIDADHQLAERMQAKEQQELADEEKATLFMQFLRKRRKVGARTKKEKRAGEELIQKRAKKQTVEDDKETTELKELMEIIPDKEEVVIIAIHLAVRVGARTKKEKRAGEELIQKRAKKQTVENDKETTELKELMEIIPDKEEVVIIAIPLAVRSPGIVDWKIYKKGKKSCYQIIRADGKS